MLNVYTKQRAAEFWAEIKLAVILVSALIALIVIAAYGVGGLYFILGVAIAATLSYGLVWTGMRMNQATEWLRNYLNR